MRRQRCKMMNEYGSWLARERATLERKDGDEGIGRMRMNERGKEGGISVRV
jgi:hypothetical protein